MPHRRGNHGTLQALEAITVEAMLARLDRLQPSTALTINQTIVPRDEWATRPVCSGDEILLFQAIAGVDMLQIADILPGY
ncbi:MAG: sulfur carrier protein ThiS [Candidatus Malihini olakiniferum]